MREIKFQAITLEGNIIKDVGKIEFFIDGHIIVNDEFPVKALREFIGLLDKNGKEIYEGDIVKYQDYNTADKAWKIANVYWMAWADWAHVPFLHPFGSPVAGKNEEDGRSVNTVYVTPSSACEVIGNIYSNPELLDGEVRE